MQKSQPSRIDEEYKNSSLNSPIPERRESSEIDLCQIMMDYQEEELQVMHKLNDNMLNRSFKKKISF